MVWVVLALDLFLAVREYSRVEEQVASASRFSSFFCVLSRARLLRRRRRRRRHVQSFRNRTAWRSKFPEKWKQRGTNDKFTAKVPVRGQTPVRHSTAYTTSSSSSSSPLPPQHRCLRPLLPGSLFKSAWHASGIESSYNGVSERKTSAVPFNNGDCNGLFLSRWTHTKFSARPCAVEGNDRRNRRC